MDGIFYDTCGEGVPVLVMHGGLGLDDQYLRPTFDEWGDFAHLVFYDHRGNGRSAPPDDWDAVTWDTLADDADRLRRELQLAPSPLNDRPRVRLDWWLE